MKECFKCNETKPLSEFYKHPQMSDGRLGKCKECTKRDVKKHRKENDSVREYDRRRYHEDPKRRAYSRANAKRWGEKNPVKKAAQIAVNNAVRDGRLVKSPCEQCGAKKVHGHHDDYSRPLDVRWLCPLCHHRHHAKERA